MKYQLLIKILIMLLNEKTVSAARIASRFDISRRTVYRYIDEITIAGIPVTVTYGQKGGFSIADSYKLPALYFTENEFSTLKSLLYSLKDQLGGNEDIASLIDKLTAQRKEADDLNITSSNLIIDATDWTGDKGFSGKLSTFSKAIDGGALLKIKYHGSDGTVTEREIEPYALALKSGLWYVYAFCRLREDFRLFKVSRVEYATKVGTFQKRPFNFSALPMKEWKGKYDLIFLELEVDPSARSDVEEWLGIGSLTEENGRLIARAILPDSATLIAELMKYGDKVMVLSPEKVKLKLLAAARRITEKYENLK